MDCGHNSPIQTISVIFYKQSVGPSFVVSNVYFYILNVLIFLKKFLFWKSIDNRHSYYPSQTILFLILSWNNFCNILEILVNDKNKCYNLILYKTRAIYYSLFLHILMHGLWSFLVFSLMSHCTVTDAPSWTLSVFCLSDKLHFLVSTYSYLYNIFLGTRHFLPWTNLCMRLPMILCQANEDDKACQKKYGAAWSEYREKVKYKVIRYVYWREKRTTLQFLWFDRTFLSLIVMF